MLSGIRSIKFDLPATEVLKLEKYKKSLIQFTLDNYKEIEESRLNKEITELSVHVPFRNFVNFEFISDSVTSPIHIDLALNVLSLTDNRQNVRLSGVWTTHENTYRSFYDLFIIDSPKKIQIDNFPKYLKSFKLFTYYNRLSLLSPLPTDPTVSVLMKTGDSLFEWKDKKDVDILIQENKKQKIQIEVPVSESSTASHSVHTPDTSDTEMTHLTSEFNRLSTQFTSMKSTLDSLCARIPHVEPPGSASHKEEHIKLQNQIEILIKEKNDMKEMLSKFPTLPTTTNTFVSSESATLTPSTSAPTLSVSESPTVVSAETPQLQVTDTSNSQLGATSILRSPNLSNDSEMNGNN